MKLTHTLQSVNSAVHLLIILFFISPTFAFAQSDITKDLSVHFATVYDNLSELDALEKNAFEQACSVERKSLCTSDDESLACLVSQQEELGACCAAKVRQKMGTPAIKTVTQHNGVNLPVGSTLEFDFHCETSTAVIPEPAFYNTTRIAAGPLVFDKNGRLKIARLSGKQVVHGLALSENQPLSVLYDNGVPQQIRLVGISEKAGIKFGPNVNSKQNSSLSSVPTHLPTNLLYLFIENQQAYGYTYSNIVLANKNSLPTTSLYENGQIAIGTVAEQVKVDGMPIAPGLTSFTQDGHIVEATLAEPYFYNGLKLAPDYIRFSNVGKLATATVSPGALLNQWEINVPSEIEMNREGEPVNIVLNKGRRKMHRESVPTIGPLVLSSGLSVSLYPNGQVTEIRRTGDLWYQNKMYPNGTHIKFAEDGSVLWDSFHDELLVNAANNKRLQNRIPKILTSVEMLGEIELPVGSLVYSHASQRDIRVIVPHPFNYRDLRIAAGEFRFNHNVGILSAFLDSDQTSGGIKLKGKPYRIDFAMDGSIETAWLAEDTLINNILFKAEPSRIKFWFDGVVRTAILAENTVINQATFAKSSEVNFSSKGHFISGKLLEPTLFDGVRYQAGRKLVFKSDGSIHSGFLAEQTTILNIPIPANAKITFMRGNYFKIEAQEQVLKIGKYLIDGQQLLVGGDGTMLTGLLAENAMLNGSPLKAGTEVSLAPDQKSGRVISTRKVAFFENKGNQSVAILTGPSNVHVFTPTPAKCKLLIAQMRQFNGYWLHYPAAQQCLEYLYGTGR